MREKKRSYFLLLVHKYGIYTLFSEFFKNQFSLLTVKKFLFFTRYLKRRVYT